MARPALIIRAPNWIGDTVYCIPTWVRLAQHYELHIVGKGWLFDLLSGYPEWHVYKLASTLWTRRMQYAHLKQQLQTSSGLATPINTLVFPTSLGSAAEPALSGLKVLGHAKEGRSIFLKQSLPLPNRFSSVYLRYWQLGDALLGRTDPVPQQIDFQINPSTENNIHPLLEKAHLRPQHYIVLCPFAGGNFEGLNKKWPLFAELAERLIQRGHHVVCCPAPNEEETWREQFAHIQALKGLSLSEYAAVFKHANMVIANDTGPGHLAAAVGVPTISVLNETVFEMYGAVGKNVSYIQNKPNWPSVDAVLAHVEQQNL